MQPTYGAVDVSAHHVDSRRCHKFALRRVPRRTRWIGILSTDAGLI
jgi:ribosomal protein L24E